jgi:hypothetical protein
MIAYGWGWHGIHKREILPACEARAEHARSFWGGERKWGEGCLEAERRMGFVGQHGGQGPGSRWAMGKAGELLVVHGK